MPSGSDGRTDRHTKSRIPRFFLVAPVPFSPASSPSRIPASLYPSPISLSYSFRAVHSPRLYRLKDVDSASNPLSIPPFGNPLPPSPPPPTCHPSDASFFLRIPYVRGKEFDSVVPARKTPSRMCGAAGIFIPEGAFRRRCLSNDDVELGNPWSIPTSGRLGKINAYLATIKRDRISRNFLGKILPRVYKFRDCGEQFVLPHHNGSTRLTEELPEIYDR